MSKIEGGLDSAFDKAAGSVFKGPIMPAQIAKRAEKQMNKEKLVGSGKQFAPTLYTVLVNAKDDNKLFAFYPTMAAEIETYLLSKGNQNGLKFDGRPLVRFIVDKNLRSGKFEVVAENVAAPTISKLRDEEAQYYGIKTSISNSAKRAALSPASLRSQLPAINSDLPPLSGPYGAGVVGAVRSSTSLAAGPKSTPSDRLHIDRRDILAGIDVTMGQNAVIGQARVTDMVAGLSYPLNRSVIIIGRDDSCDIPIDDANASRQHAQLSQDATGLWKLTDLGSTNGTSLNGSPVASALLRDGDQLTFGITTLEFRES